MEENDWNQTAFASRLGVSLSLLNMVLNGERPLTAGLMLKLGANTRIPSDVWSKHVNEYAKWSQSGEGQMILRGEGSKAASSIPTNLQAGILVDSQILYAKEEGLLTIDPFSEEMLEVASYDFRIGEIARYHGEIVKEPGCVVTLGVKEAAYVQSLEKVRLSNRIAGRISIPTALVMDGIFMSCGLQIDPGYEGYLFGLIKNEGPEKCEIELHKTVIFSIEFHALSITPRQAFDKKRKRNSLPAMPETILGVKK